MKVEQVKEDFKQIKNGSNAFAIETPPAHIKLHTVCLAVGKRGAGKSRCLSSLLQWLKDAKCMDRIILVSMTAESNSAQFEGLNIDPEDIFNPDEPGVVNRIIQLVEDERDDLLEYREKMKLYKEVRKTVEDPLFAIEHFEDVYEILFEYYDPETRKWKPPKHRYNGRRPVIGVFIDDAFGTNIFRPNKRNNFVNLVLKHRHLGSFPTDEPSLGISLFMAVQAYTGLGGALPKAVRGNITHMFLFKSKNEKELRLICDEMSGEVSPEKFYDVYNFAMENGGDFPCLFIDLHKKKEHPSMFRIGYEKWIMLSEEESKYQPINPFRKNTE